MLNANSERELVTYTESDDQDEWYDLVLTCNNCHRKFMTYDFAPNYCPFCGGKFANDDLLLNNKYIIRKDEINA